MSVSTSARRVAGVAAGVVGAATVVTLAAGVSSASSGPPVPVPAPSGQQLSVMEDSALSADGRFVAFGGATASGEGGLFLHDRADGETVRLETTVDGEPLDGAFRQVAVSADASRIVFVTGHPEAQDLVDPTSQVWLLDRAAGSTLLLSAAPDGTPGDAGSDQPAISADGQVVAFRTHAADLVGGTSGEGGDIVARDLRESGLELVSGPTTPGSFDPDGSWGPALSADGRHVAFVSTQTLASRSAASQPDAWVRDRETEGVRLASVPLDGVAGPVSDVSISGDGTRVAFSRVTRQVKFFTQYGIAVHDQKTGEVVAADVELAAEPGTIAHPRLSQDGRHVLFLDMRGGAYVRDLELGQTRVVPVPAGADEDTFTGLSFSADGRVAAVERTSPPSGVEQRGVSRLVTADLGPTPTTSDASLSQGDRPWIATTQRKVAARGHELEVQPGRWEPVLGAKVTHQWLRDGKVIRGATRRTYVLKRADMGADIRVRESVVAAGLPTSSMRSVAFPAKRSFTEVRLRGLKSVRARQPFHVRVRVLHHEGNRPQGRVRVAVGDRVRTARIDRDGVVRVRFGGLAAGRHHISVKHFGTAFVRPGGTVKKSFVVRR